MAAFQWRSAVGSTASSAGQLTNLQAQRRLKPPIVIPCRSEPSAWTAGSRLQRPSRPPTSQAHAGGVRSQPRLAWSLVDGFDLLSSLGFTTFEASTRGGSRQVVRELLDLEPIGEATLEFQFDVPPFVIGAEFCTRVFVGVDPRPLVTTVRERFLFCIIGGTTGFEVMSESESQASFESLSGKSRRSPEKRPVPAR
jgi:hypothetical protein